MHVFVNIYVHVCSMRSMRSMRWDLCVYAGCVLSSLKMKGDGQHIKLHLVLSACTGYYGTSVCTYCHGHMRLREAIHQSHAWSPMMPVRCWSRCTSSEAPWLWKIIPPRIERIIVVQRTVVMSHSVRVYAGIVCVPCVLCVMGLFFAVGGPCWSMYVLWCMHVRMPRCVSVYVYADGVMLVFFAFSEQDAVYALVRHYDTGCNHWMYLQQGPLNCGKQKINTYRAHVQNVQSKSPNA